MKKILFSDIVQNLQKLSPSQSGVFSYSDLFNLIGADSNLQNKRIILRLIREKFLFKVYRGYYVTPHPDLWILASRLKKEVYISMDSILAKNGLIGTVPRNSASAIYPGIRKEIISTPFGTIRFFSIQRDLLFGISPFPYGIRVADNEKAYLDLLYYRSKGAKFVIDPLKEVDLKKLNFSKIKKYLRYYKNPKFVAFVKGIFDEPNN